MRQTLFARIDAEWSTFVDSPSVRRRFGEWQRADADLAEFVDLHHLVQFAQTPGQPAASDDESSLSAPCYKLVTMSAYGAWEGNSHITSQQNKRYGARLWRCSHAG